MKNRTEELQEEKPKLIEDYWKEYRMCNVLGKKNMIEKVFRNDFDIEDKFLREKTIISHIRDFLNDLIIELKKLK